MKTLLENRTRACYSCGTTYEEQKNYWIGRHKCTPSVYLNARAILLHLLEEKHGTLLPDLASLHAREFWRWMHDGGLLVEYREWIDRAPEHWFTILFDAVCSYMDEMELASCTA